MKARISRLLLAGLAATAASVAVAQPGGGFGGGRGGGGNTGSSSGISQEESLAGTWTFEFELEFDADNPDAIGDLTTFRVDVTVIGTEVSGRFRNPAEGEFNCTILQGSERCYSGRLLLVWPGQDVRESGDFEFSVDRIDLRHAKGEARFQNRSGSIRVFSVEMDKR